MKKTFPCAATRTCNYAFISCHFKGLGIFSTGSSRHGVPCHLSSGEIAGCVRVFEEQVVWLVIPLGEDSSVGRQKEITEQEPSSVRSLPLLTVSSDIPARCCYLYSCGGCVFSEPFEDEMQSARLSTATVGCDWRSSTALVIIHIILETSFLLARINISRLPKGKSHCFLPLTVY